MKKLLFLLLFLGIATTCFAQPVQISAVTKVSGKELYKVTLGAENDEVIIGDEKNFATFKNQITFKKWFNEKQGDFENHLSVIPPADLIPNATVTSSNGQVLIRNNKIGFYYNKDPTSDDNLKFGLILYKKPDTNTWSFQLEGWEEYDFFYQDIWKNIEVFTKNGEDWVRNLDEQDHPTRSIKVQGSYAIYHKTKKWAAVGRTNYKTGKFGHYYRPKFIDANNNIVWANLNIINGIVTITVSQNFLDNAVYPVKANDEFGYHTAGGSAGSFDVPNDGIVAKMVGTAPSGILNYITWYLEVSAHTPTFKYALYDDITTTPTTRRAIDANAFTVGDGVNSYFWASNSVDYNFTLVNGTQYSIGGLWVTAGGAGYVGYYYDVDASYLRRFGSNTGLPDPWTNTTNSATRKVSCYATYTSSGGATTGKVMIVN